MPQWEQTATLLLNYIPDERWKELHQPEHCYGKAFNYSSTDSILQLGRHFVITTQLDLHLDLEVKQHCPTNNEKNYPNAAIQAMNP